MECKNLFSYPEGTVFTGEEILSFINYHLKHRTGKTRIAAYMARQFGKLYPDKRYKFFASWVDTNLNLIRKPRLLRIDHSAPLVSNYDTYDDSAIAKPYTFEGRRTVLKC